MAMGLDTDFSMASRAVYESKIRIIPTGTASDCKSYPYLDFATTHSVKDRGSAGFVTDIAYFRRNYYGTNLVAKVILGNDDATRCWLEQCDDHIVTGDHMEEIIRRLERDICKYGENKNHEVNGDYDYKDATVFLNICKCIHTLFDYEKNFLLFSWIS